MEMKQSIKSLSQSVKNQRAKVETEEATKTAFVMPFIQNVLGYNVFDLNEVTPEYTADVGTKKGEKVDYAILKDGQVQILIECKKIGADLTLNHASQLFRYFSVSNARLGILTNGAKYQFYTDLDTPNKMDERPFLELDLEHVDDHVLPQLAKITKSAFDIGSVINAAEELKYINALKKELVNQFASPDEEFVKLFAKRVYGGKILTAKVIDQFTGFSVKACEQLISDKVSSKLKKALGDDVDTSTVTIETAPTASPENQAENLPEDNGIITTDEELQGYHIVKAILCEHIPTARIEFRDAKTYFAILLDNNNRKPLARLHLDKKQKFLTLFDTDKKGERHNIESIDEIYAVKQRLIATLTQYE